MDGENSLGLAIPRTSVLAFCHGGFIGPTDKATGTSAANTLQTVSTPIPTPSNRKRVKWVMVAYSAAPTQAGVTITLNANEGSAYDTLLVTGTANARYTFWQPTGGGLDIAPGDAIDVAAPAGGGVITSSVIICYGPPDGN